VLLAGLSASMSILRCDLRSERLFDVTESVPGIGISGESTPTLTNAYPDVIFPLLTGGPRLARNAKNRQSFNYWSGSTFPSYTIFPPTIVSTDSVFGRSEASTVKMSCERTARSASLLGSRLPLSFSANSAYADVRV